MSTFSTLNEAKEFFANDRFATGNDMELIDLTDDGCVCRLVLSDKHRNGFGGVMGGVVFTLADFAFAIASNNEHLPTEAADADIRFLSPVRGSVLTATARIIKSGRTTCVVQVDVSDDSGADIALFTATGYKFDSSKYAIIDGRFTKLS